MCSTDRLLIDPVHDCGLLRAVRAVTGIRNCTLIVHGRLGCHSGMLALQAATSSHKYVNVIFSGLRSEEMYTGGENRLKIAILNTYKIAKPRLIIIASASAIGIMGDNVDGVIREVSREVKSKIVHIEAYGYSRGEYATYEETLVKICQELCKRNVQKVSKSINIIGFHPDEPHWHADLREMMRFLKYSGVRVNCILSWCSTEEIENIGKAELNVVLGGEGIRVAEFLEKELGIPYIIVPYPIGMVNMEEFLEKTCRELGLNLNNSKLVREYSNAKRSLKHYETYIQGIYGVLRVTLVGESYRVFSLARFLQEELGEDIEYIAIRVKNEYTEDYIKTWREISEIISDRYELYTKLKNIKPDVMYASTYERDIALRCGIPLVRLFYPTLDEVTITDRPIVGPKGALTIVEKTINEMLRMQEKVELAYLTLNSETNLGDY